MKKINPKHPPPPITKRPNARQPAHTSGALVSPISSNQKPASHIFTILPNVDSESLLCHACENLASLNVMATNLAGELEGSYRNVALAIQQLVVLSELLVNRALDDLDPP